MLNPTRIKRKSRRNQGNIIILCLLCSAIAAVTLFVGYGMFNLYFGHSLLQGFADKVALAAACALNDSDRIGDMNNLIAQARQLVYASRDMSQSISSADPELQMLANQLLDEDRSNAAALEQERVHLANVVCTEAQTAMENAFDDQTGIYRAVFPSLRISAPKMVSVTFGYVNAVDSNVALLTGIDQLASYDRSSNVVNSSSSLYVGNKNVKLPGADRDLNFNLSSLPAPVTGAVSPARLILPSEIQQLDSNNRQLASAISVVISAQDSNGTDIHHVVSAAATNGALPEE
jgi:hypothetical protein